MRCLLGDAFFACSGGTVTLTPCAFSRHEAADNTRHSTRHAARGAMRGAHGAWRPPSRAQDNGRGLGGQDVGCVPLSAQGGGREGARAVAWTEAECPAPGVRGTGSFCA